MADIATTAVRQRLLLTGPDARIFDADITGSQQIFPLERNWFRTDVDVSTLVANDTATIAVQIGPEQRLVELVACHLNLLVDNLTYDGSANTAFMEIQETTSGGSDPRDFVSHVPFQNNRRLGPDNTQQNIFFLEKDVMPRSAIGSGCSFDLIFQLVTGLAAATARIEARLDFLLYPWEAERSASFYLPLRYRRQGM